MPMETLLVWLIVGAVSGWLAGQIVKGGGFGLLGDIVVGIIGAFVGGWLFDVLHITLSIGNALLNAIFVSTIGAVALLATLRVVRGR
mgnify:CR=1 FL=1